MRTKLSEKQIADIVIALNGEIEPIGESNYDEKAFNNQMKLQGILDILFDEILFLLPYQSRYEYSMKRSGEEARKWLNEKMEWLNGVLQEEE